MTVRELSAATGKTEQSIYKYLASAVKYGEVEKKEVARGFKSGEAGTFLTTVVYSLPNRP